MMRGASREWLGVHLAGAYMQEKPIKIRVFLIFAYLTLSGYSLHYALVPEQFTSRPSVIYAAGFLVSVYMVIKEIAELIEALK